MRFRFWRRPPLSCEEVGRLLQQYLDEYLDDHLNQARRAQLEAHLKECERCGFEAETMQRIRDVLHAHGRAIADHAAVGRLQAFAERLADTGEASGPSGRASR